MALTSDDVNRLVYQYLVEAGTYVARGLCPCVQRFSCAIRVDAWQEMQCGRRMSGIPTRTLILHTQSAGGHMLGLI